MSNADKSLAKSQSESKTKFRLAGHDLTKTREEHDFYQTPPSGISVPYTPLTLPTPLYV